MANKTYRAPKKDIEKALVESLGNISRAAQQFKKPDGTAIAWQTFQGWIEHYGIEYYPMAVKKRIARNVLEKTYVKAMQEGDNQCMFKILDRWGKHIGFEEEPTKVEQKIEADVDVMLKEALKEIKEEDKDLIKAREK